MNDPFEAHALFALDFKCDKCGRSLEFTSDEEMVSDLYFKQLADKARLSGWICPPADDEGNMDVMTCYCPECGASQEK